MGSAEVKQPGDDLSGAAYWDRVAQDVENYYLIPKLAKLKADEYNRLLGDWGIDRKGRILFTDLYEAACGGQSFYQYPRDRYLGIDISALICRRAKLNERDGRMMALCADVRQLPLRDNGLDAIVSPSTLDHFPQIGQALEECYRILKPGGRMVLALNSASNPFFRLGVRLAERFKRYEYQADYFYSIDQVATLLRQAGFSVGRSTALMHLPVGLTTVIEILDRAPMPALGWLVRLLIDVCSRWGRSRSRLKIMTGWWVAVEGIKAGDDEKNQ